MISSRSLDSGQIERLDDALFKIKDAALFSLLTVNLAPFETQLKQSNNYADSLALTSEAMVRCNVTAETAMHDLLGKGVLVHNNQILVHESTANGHLSLLRTVLTRCSEAEIFLVAPLSKFGLTTVSIDGRMLSSNKPVQLNPRYVAPLKSIRKIENADQLRSFLATIAFLRRYINNFDATVKPLVDLRAQSRKNKKNFQWTDDHQKALQSLIDALPSAK